LLAAEAVRLNSRIDGRERSAARDFDLAFGREFGTCIVGIGNTRVLSKVTCELAEPMPSRPSEGMLKVSVDLSPMADPSFESRGLLDESVELVRLLERSIRESKCIDMEGLCLISGEKCWRIRVNVVALNNEGNLIETCSLASIAALAHFKRPDVTISNDKVKVHTFEEKHPIPLTIHHLPICTKYCFFNDRKHYVVDPSELEEQVCEGYIVVGGNSLREITTLHVTGRSLISQDMIMACCAFAMERIKSLTQAIKIKLAEDKSARDGELDIGFAQLLRTQDTSVLVRQLKTKFEAPEVVEDVQPQQMQFDAAEKTTAYRFIGNTFGVGEGGPSTWDFIDKEDNDDRDDTLEPDNIVNAATKKKLNLVTHDSSDDEVMIIQSVYAKAQA
jgi:exosome complex component RRP45